MLNLSGGKGALTPGGKDVGRDVRDSDGELEYSDAKRVQAAAGLEQCITLGRPDIACSVKTPLQQMSKPTKLMQHRVVRVGRYLKNNPRLVWKFPYQQQPKSIDVFVGADFGSRETMLRSTSGVSEYYGRSPIERLRQLSCRDASAGTGIASKGVQTSEASLSQAAVGAGQSLGESIATSQASHRNQHR